MGRKLINRENKYPQPINDEGVKVIKLRCQPQPKSIAQEFYLESLREAPLTFGVGPAGCGKSFLAMAVGLEKLLANRVQKLVLTRPVCEAGENLGFLPGTFEEKIAPYLLPLLDAAEDLIGPTMTKKLLDTGKIEFAPLAYMRGRGFFNSYVILDESQNSTVEQMKLFLTRAGENTTLVVNGDPMQTDLRVKETGLDYAIRRLSGKSNMINVVSFGHTDIQRSKLVKEILLHLDGPDDGPPKK